MKNLCFLPRTPTFSHLERVGRYLFHSASLLITTASNLVWAWHLLNFSMDENVEHHSLQETGVLPSARDFAVSFLSGLTAKGTRPSAVVEADGKDGADGVHFLCRQPIVSRRLADGNLPNS